MNDVLGVVAKYLKPIEKYSLQTVYPKINVNIAEGFRNRMKRDGIFDFIKEISDNCEIMISGSYPLQYLLNEKYQDFDTDIDIYLHKKDKKNIEGFTTQDHMNKLDMAYCVKIDGIKTIDEVRYCHINNKYQNINQKIIQFIVLHDDVPFVNIVDLFDMNYCRNYYISYKNSCEFIIQKPYNVLKKYCVVKIEDKINQDYIANSQEDKISLDFIIHKAIRYSDRIDKYKDRGFNIDEYYKDVLYNDRIKLFDYLINTKHIVEKIVNDTFYIKKLYVREHFHRLWIICLVILYSQEAYRKSKNTNSICLQFPNMITDYVSSIGMQYFTNGEDVVVYLSGKDTTEESYNNIDYTDYMLLFQP